MHPQSETLTDSSARLHAMNLTKPDGRALKLFSRRPIPPDIVATNPKHEPVTGFSHLRWHPLRGEWVAYASHRQDRTFLPPKEFNPLAPTRGNAFPTELPAGDYDIAVFENLFASLSLGAGATPAGGIVGAPALPVPTAPGTGVCEVVVFTQDSETTLSRLPVDHIELLFRVWADRTTEIGRQDQISYVLPFENRGVEVGVTLHHPHGQIYAYPFVPPIPARMAETQLRYWEDHARGLMSDLIASERRDQTRLIAAESDALAFIPACARYPYEVWVAPQRPVAFLSELTDAEVTSLARVLKTVLQKYDGLWQRPFPYLMAIYQAPTDGTPHPEFHFHIEFYPPYRSRDRLKFLAGTELAAGMFVNDSLPEEKAAELRKVEVQLT